MPVNKKDVFLKESGAPKQLEPKAHQSLMLTMLKKKYYDQ